MPPFSPNQLYFALFKFYFRFLFSGGRCPPFFRYTCGALSVDLVLVSRISEVRKSKSNINRVLISGIFLFGNARIKSVLTRLLIASVETYGFVEILNVVKKRVY